MLFNDDGTVWLGTEGGGLNLYDMKNRTVKTFTVQEGLPSNDIYSLQRDDKKRLWVSTGKGIALIDSLRVSNLNYAGNIDKEYNKSSFARLMNGEFVYGSTDGAVFIMPLDISTVDYWTLLRFTGLTVDYQNVQEEESLKPAIHDMLADRAVRLGYKYNSFTVSFESINYRFQRDIVYQHILEGYDNDWSKPSAEGKASYTKVSPGTYLFKVRSLRRSDGKTISESTLEVKVSQPWWNSWWAWTIYLFIIGFVFYFILRYKSNQLQKKYDEDKIRFFIDTAHDIRTPVTLIMAPLEDLNREQDLSDKARYYLNLAHESTRKLHSLITQLLEFEKVDAHKQSSSSVPLCLNEVLLKEVSVFRSFCEKKQLTLNLTQPDESVFVSADKHLIEMLLDNLLSNACKYTMPQGEISLDLKATKRKAILSLKDNGIGIPKKAKKHIFSDVMMPGIRGDELCRMVKENPDTSGIPVVLLTAKANHEAIVEGLKKGADDYIPKPFSTEILKLKVQGLIDNRNRQRQFFMRQAIAQVEAGGKRDDNESNENNESIDNKNVTTASETMAEGDRRFIMQATRFVLEHLDEPDFNINLLCHEMAMSRTLFYSRLKSLTGKGPQEFIRIIRLQKAAELLKEGKSVTDVAAETGFVNTKYFSSLFKKQFGMQPSKYSGK